MSSTTTPLRVGYVDGSGALFDVAASVTVTNTRIHGIHATGIGSFLITGTSTSPYGAIRGNNIRFKLTTTTDAMYMDLSDLGVLMAGNVKVSAPTSASSTTIFYG